MMKRYLALVVLTLTSALAFAQYNSDEVRVVVTPNHADWNDWMWKQMGL